MKRTPLYQEHLKFNAKMVEFGGWDMPLNFPSGIITEHLSTRRSGGLFDISHMGRFLVGGKGALPFLQYVLTNNGAALCPGEAQYTMIPDENGGAVDDAYLYRFNEDEYLLVVNAANTEKDWAWLGKYKSNFPGLKLENMTAEISMLSLQGPKAKEVLGEVAGGENKLPEPQKNKLAVVEILGREVPVSRTGYTGEPVGFEIFPPSDIVVALYHRLLEYGKEAGIIPAGLGARDTLRLEAGLPLYGHELGVDANDREIPIMALPISKAAVSFAEVKGKFIGCEKIRSQFEEVKLRQERVGDAVEAGACVPRMITPLVISGAGIARAGFPVYAGDKPVGSVTSGTAVPYWEFEKVAGSKPGNQSRNRALALAYLDSALEEWQRVSIQVRDRAVEGMVVKRFLSGQAPPYARPIFPEDSLNV